MKETLEDYEKRGGKITYCKTGDTALDPLTGVPKKKVHVFRVSTNRGAKPGAKKYRGSRVKVL